eukprot:gene23283-29706_t
MDDPGTAVDGNQVSGTYGLTVVDTTGNIFNSTSAFIPVTNVNGEAYSAADLQNKFVELFDGQSLVNVTRSAEPNDVMGYTYSIQFTGESVGGDMPMMVADTTALYATATASTSRAIGVLCVDSSVCVLGTYVVNVGIDIEEAVK